MNKYVERMKMIKRVSLLLITDMLFIAVSGYVALMVRYQYTIPPEMMSRFITLLPLNILIILVALNYFNMYRSLWSYASMVELRRLIMAVGSSAVVMFVLERLIMRYTLPGYWYAINAMFVLAGCSFIRFMYRNMRSLRQYFNQDDEDDIDHVMIIGAGEAGNMLLRETIKSNRIAKKVVCFIDDDKNKKGLFMNDVPIVGDRNTILENVKKYDVDEIYIAIPSASRKERSEIVEICKDTGCKLKILPGIYQLINNEVSVSRLKNVEIEDLLGRDPIIVDNKQIASYLKDKVVMVTGGGGSIGSELCRQIAANAPKQLIIVDIYENNAYNIQMELVRSHPELDLVVRIASIRDEHKINVLFDEFRPQIVYHAAAHKHVPLMEDSPNEAIKNNVFGTWNVIRAASRYGVERFVQISTDKAVNPTNIMGATKRMCEMLIQAENRHSKTHFTAVRFGNVLGSNGSVIPLFKQQILQGGPVTVTHPEITRFFMTIPEAVSLVLQAGIYANGGEIFVLDMGSPVKIDDLARNLIKLSGYTPDVDIKVEYTGLRPGEKLYEELLMSEEGLTKTKNNSIFIGKPIEFDDDTYYQQLQELRTHLIEESDEIKNRVHEIVPTYVPWKE